MKIKEILQRIDIDSFRSNNLEEIKREKSILSKTEKKELIKIWANAKTEPKENILRAVICYAIWNPDEAIKEARRKGIFRYKIFGMGKSSSNAQYYLNFLVENLESFKFSRDTESYLIKKASCEWLKEFYLKTENKIDTIMKEHQKKRIRKRIRNTNVESALYKELLAYIDILFFMDSRPRKEGDLNSLESFPNEEIAEGVSYLLFKYVEKYGISKDKNYIIDAGFVQSKEMEQLVLYACQINEMLELELLVDFYDYDILQEGKKIIIKSTDPSFEKSIRLAYINQQMQEIIFYRRQSEMAEKGEYISELSRLMVNEIENVVVKQVKDGILSRYVFKIPIMILEKLAEQNIDGKIALYEEEMLEIECFLREMSMTDNELYEKKITEHCNMYDIILCQRIFRFVYYMQKEVYLKHLKRNSRVVLQSLIPMDKKENIIQNFERMLKDPQKAKEMYELLEYNDKFKFDLQYTPFISVGEYVMYPISILAYSNLLRNTIAYSYLSKNKIVNDDNGLEPLVRECRMCFEHCKYDYKIYTNKKYKYKGKKGEIDVLVVSEKEIIIIECKDPLHPTSNFEMRATFEHIEKASKQLDDSKEAFEDDGFRKKFLKDSLKMDGKRRSIRTCIVLGNRMFSIWSESKHPIRNVKELNMILNTGVIVGDFVKWRIWKEQDYSHDDLIDFLNPKGKFISLMNSSMEKYDKRIKLNGKTLVYESYRLNMATLYLKCDEELRLLEKDEKKWSEFLEEYKKEQRRDARFNICNEFN